MTFWLKEKRIIIKNFIAKIIKEIEKVHLNPKIFLILSPIKESINGSALYCFNDVILFPIFLSFYSPLISCKIKINAYVRWKKYNSVCVCGCV